MEANTLANQNDMQKSKKLSIYHVSVVLGCIVNLFIAGRLKAIQNIAL